MSFKELFETQDLENITEELVFEQIHSIIENDEADVPNNPDCILDIAAIALNRLPPKYAVSFLDKVNPRNDRLEELIELGNKARKEVLRAIDIVVKNPRHR